MASRVIRVHTVCGTVTAIVVWVTLHSEAESDAGVAVVSIEISLCGEWGGGGERDINVDVVNMVVCISNVFIHNPNIELEGSLLTKQETYDTTEFIGDCSKNRL